MLAAEPCVAVGTMGYALLCHLESAQPRHGSHVVWWRGTDWPLCPLWWRERGSQARSLKLDPPEPSFLGKRMQRLKLNIYAVSPWTFLSTFVYVWRSYMFSILSRLDWQSRTICQHVWRVLTRSDVTSFQLQSIC